MDQWLIIYREYTTPQLTEELTWLRDQSRNIFASMTEGNRGYSKSNDEVSTRLAAATQVMGERTHNPNTTQVFQADFSGVRI